jgi:hypothetical protein
MQPSLQELSVLGRQTDIVDGKVVGRNGVVGLRQPELSGESLRSLCIARYRVWQYSLRLIPCFRYARNRV